MGPCEKYLGSPAGVIKKGTGFRVGSPDNLVLYGVAVVVSVVFELYLYLYSGESSYICSSPAWPCHTYLYIFSSRPSI